MSLSLRSFLQGLWSIWTRDSVRNRTYHDVLSPTIFYLVGLFELSTLDIATNCINLLLRFRKLFSRSKGNKGGYCLSPCREGVPTQRKGLIATPLQTFTLPGSNSPYGGVLIEPPIESTVQERVLQEPLYTPPLNQIPCTEAIKSTVQERAL
ncbi:uncharacterized protein BDR25DRAFT_356639 [Lindgomyces ingoldianus]|uniref:Uncharacterized protein n=1 Tax=Lindgomyces ingoldianus TaxID=673940 RepID=A0ACB6QSB1_9PLEO|nr:uncharacterized protein BDR25DRAFT_356639 [Lindgomyces ingoldianus]KAF2469405.1 hypothetical protein BDR25DRAFT_356639 [Lindgomyces ingoldianus]